MVLTYDTFRLVVDNKKLGPKIRLMFVDKAL